MESYSALKKKAILTCYNVNEFLEDTVLRAISHQLLPLAVEYKVITISLDFRDPVFSHLMLPL